MPSSLSPARVASGLLNLLFPDICRVCEQPLVEVARYPVCSSCLAEPEPISAEFLCAACRTPFVTPHPLDAAGLCGLCRRGLNGFDAAYSYGFYEGTLRKLVHLFKYGGVYTLAKPLGKQLVQAFPCREPIDVLAPVPMHWWRKWRRGFNQAELLAREVSGRTGVPVIGAARRKRSTPPQAGLNDRLRRKNVSQAFTVPKPAAVCGLHVLLIDDVLTTGATVSACALALRNAGARKVSVLTLARADRRITPDEPRPARQRTASTGGC